MYSGCRTYTSVRKQVQANLMQERVDGRRRVQYRGYHLQNFATKVYSQNSDEVVSDGLSTADLSGNTKACVKANSTVTAQEGAVTQADSTRPRMVDAWKTWHTKGFPFEPSACPFACLLKHISTLIACLCAVARAYSSWTSQIRVRPRITTDPTYRSLPQTARDVVHTTLLSRNKRQYLIKLLTLFTLMSGVSGSTDGSGFCFTNSTQSTEWTGADHLVSKMHSLAVDLCMLSIQVFGALLVVIQVLSVKYSGTIALAFGHSVCRQ